MATTITCPNCGSENLDCRETVVERAGVTLAVDAGGQLYNARQRAISSERIGDATWACSSPSCIGHDARWTARELLELASVCVA